MEWFDFTAESVKRLRGEMNVSQKVLGNMLGIPQQRICDWEKGGVPNDPLLRAGLLSAVAGLKKYTKSGVIK